ncbi:MAG: hypothetical protein NC213_02330 [Acetobacter sp.]|nr:hypothetical protein [Bacteroides sp.]MCM1340558.1 hypothetical protein [Acetobacter sp.]MCM1433298.1 serine/threonine protein kinase [Clostridiales bacterium]
MIFQKIDEIEYKIKEPFNFDFIHKYGHVFRVYDDQDSGNICFGTEKNGKRYFVKFAGAPTAEYKGSSENAVKRLIDTLSIYEDLNHKSLIKFLSAEKINGGFAMIFEWSDGKCMGRMYDEDHKSIMSLPVNYKLDIFDEIIDFIEYIVSKNYVAVDFYDGSIMYDEESHKTTICDIDFFKKQPVVNDMGRMWGSERFISPEECKLGQVIDEITNVFTLGKMAFSLITDSDYSFDSYPLNKKSYDVLVKATESDRNKRYQSIAEFKNAWCEAITESMTK